MTWLDGAAKILLGMGMAKSQSTQRKSGFITGVVILAVVVAGIAAVSGRSQPRSKTFVCSRPHVLELSVVGASVDLVVGPKERELSITYVVGSNPPVTKQGEELEVDVEGDAFVWKERFPGWCRPAGFTLVATIGHKPHMPLSCAAWYNDIEKIDSNLSETRSVRCGFPKRPG